ncbi:MULTISPECIES: hypothetical protein [Bacillus cereus group]|uniref:hypothetical protein n=1 Tax=Bacillus cereus group TaxID=86661 RepID=UPI000BED4CF6|nr:MULTISPECIES: hypothetical protein [Bacillus cereus group]MCC6080404.1 hypothetical protein [Bacillus thuringiensis]PEB12992.1 hypothetical protein COM67_08585 [Bacillus thuringiensis]PEB57943.1 hypothetical protein COM79_12235 [Bacillus cereus]PEB69924.1 hypothetical protein COM91_10350 [Bacillus thuringiensis]PEB85519.1 hypothetical protein COM94_19980 [Bacillus thuringiensis]
MRSFGSLLISTICSTILLVWNFFSFYTGFTTRHTYYWVNGIIALVFLLLFILNTRDIIKQNYRTSGK